MKSTHLTLALLASTLFVAGTAEAKNTYGDKYAHKGKYFEMMDTNSDGFVTKDEMLEKYKAKINRKMEHMDKDGDGRLSMDEMSKKYHKMMKKKGKMHHEEMMNKKGHGHHGLYEDEE